MKKFKLFLLTGIVSILSIGCFTNADSVTTTCKGYTKPCSNYDYTTTVYSSTYSCFNVPANTDSIVISPTCTANFNYFYGGSSTYSKPCGVDYTFTDKSFICVSNSNGTYVITFNPKPLLPGGFDGSLTPAINGLHDTVREIIPYIVYIGIGVLLAILGFYAVRWLVNRIARKINSVFRSKRS